MIDKEKVAQGEGCFCPPKKKQVYFLFFSKYLVQDWQ